MAKTGRPRVQGESVYVRLDPEVAEALKEYMDIHNVPPAKISKNSVINFAVAKFLNSQAT